MLEVLAAPDGLGALESVFSYLSEVRDDEFLDALAKQTNDQRIESFAMSYKQRLIDQGLEKGREEGREDSRRILSKLLQLKFGAVDEATERRLEGARRAELVAWADRVLDAATISDVFGDPRD